MDDILASLNEATEAFKSAMEAMDSLKAKCAAAGTHVITDDDLHVIENFKCTRKNYEEVSNRARRFFDRTIEEMLQALNPTPTPTASGETAESSDNTHNPTTPETTWHNNALDPNQDD